MTRYFQHAYNACRQAAKEIEEETTTEANLSARELFLSQQYASLPATHIRGKCRVALPNETDSIVRS